jgi:hypothetical protein
MSNVTDYAPKNLKSLLPKDVPPIPGSAPVTSAEDLKAVEDKLRGYLKEINDSRVFKICADLKQLTWDEAESIGKGLATTAKRMELELDATQLTQVVQHWATGVVAPPSITEENDDVRDKT